jgi:hypothetical protein
MRNGRRSGDLKKFRRSVAFESRSSKTIAVIRLEASAETTVTRSESVEKRAKEENG